jgi:hypothetical protein
MASTSPAQAHSHLVEPAASFGFQASGILFLKTSELKLG